MRVTRSSLELQYPRESYKILVRASGSSQEMQDPHKKLQDPHKGCKILRILTRNARILTRITSMSELQDPRKRCKILDRASGTIFTRVARFSSELHALSSQEVQDSRQGFRNDPHESCKILIRASETSQEVQDQELEGPF